MKNALILALLFGLAAIPGAHAAIPAFPGAGGGGAASVGGRGGTVIEVTNLNDDGPGSLRAACLASGPRTVVFRVAGIITLKSTIIIANPFITIAGQTAPAGGILLTNVPKGQDGIVVTAHDVIIRFIRIRDTHDGISIKDGACNVMIDHCSLSWGRDENMSVNMPSYDITFSWVLNAECLMPHSCGILIKGGEAWDPVNSPKMVNIDLDHNLFMNLWNRCPLYSNVQNGQFINNIVYNWGWYGSSFRGQNHGGGVVDFIGNFYRRGPSFKGIGAMAYKNTPVSKAEIITHDNPNICIRGNKGPNQSDPEADNWGMMERLEQIWVPAGTPPGRARERKIPQARTFPITVQHVDEIERLVPEDAGASRRLDEHGRWVPNRDSVDDRLIREYRAGASKAIANPKEVGGLPKIAAGSPYPDSDHDGMPDAWEKSQGLDPNKNDSAGDQDRDGYTNLETFLNSKQ